MNPSNPSFFARPLFVFSFGITLLIAAAMYPSRVQAATLTIDLPDCTSFQLSGNTVQCVKSGPATPSCSIVTHAAQTTNAGGAVSLSGNCSGFTPYWITWAKDTNWQFSFQPGLTDSLPANSGASAVTYRYGLTACDTNSVCAPTAWTNVTVPGSTGVGTPFAGSCPGYAKTLFQDLSWVNGSDPIRMYTNNFGGFNYNDAMVIKLNPPGGVTSANLSGYIAGGEYGGGAINRLAVLSATPCDFDVSNATTLWNAQGGTSFTFNFQLGGSQPQYAVLFQPGTPYYLNVKNVGCPSGGQCNMSIDFHRTPGT